MSNVISRSQTTLVLPGNSLLLPEDDFAVRLSYIDCQRDEVLKALQQNQRVMDQDNEVFENNYLLITRFIWVPSVVKKNQCSLPAPLRLMEPNWHGVAIIYTTDFRRRGKVRRSLTWGQFLRLQIHSNYAIDLVYPPHAL